MSGRLWSDNVLLLMVDWQEKLFPAMPEGLREAALAKAGLLRWLAGELGLPVIFTEQYPKGLGPTLPALNPVNPIEKLSFSAMGEPNVSHILAQPGGRRQILLTGMETHICVAQTAVDLRSHGYDVRVIADAVLSRRKLDWRTGLSRMEAAGALSMTAEAVAFELVERAGSPIFKELSRRIR